MPETGKRLGSDWELGFKFFSVDDWGASKNLADTGNLRVPLGGDFILSINGEPIEDMRTLTVFLETRTRVGETAMLSYWRDGQVTDVQVVLGERRSRRRR